MDDRSRPAAHRVVHLQVEDLRHGAQREAQRNRVPVVAVDRDVVGEEQPAEVTRRRGDVAEVNVALLERPPARCRHPGVADRCRDRRHLLGGPRDDDRRYVDDRRHIDVRRLGARASSRLFDVEAVPVEVPTGVLGGRDHDLGVAGPGGEREAVLEAGVVPRVAWRRGEARPGRGLPPLDGAEHLVARRGRQPGKRRADRGVVSVEQRRRRRSCAGGAARWQSIRHLGGRLRRRREARRHQPWPARRRRRRARRATGGG